MSKFIRGIMLLLAALLAACDGGGGGGQVSTGGIQLPDYMRQGYETYHETGGVARPSNAIDVFIAYSLESQQYMPRIIEQFNRLSAEGKNPVTGQAWAEGERPIFVAGQQPTTGSSGSVAQGVINAIVAPNNENVYHPTIFQPSVSHWLAQVNFNTGRQIFDLSQAKATAVTPVVIAMWQSRLDAIRQQIGKQDISWNDLLGVLESDNGWCDYNVTSCRRAVFYGHTDPRISSTGLSTTIGEFYACARQNGFSERRLTLEAVNSPDVQECVKRIEGLVRHYSSRTEDFLEYISRGPDYLDFLALEETDLLCLNRGAQQGDQTCTKPQEPLVAIYPEEGTFWHEHPFGILNADWVTPEQQEAARVFTEFVLTPAMQTIIMSEGFRPANTDVELTFPFVAENGVDVTQPRTVLDVPAPEVIAAIQQSWSLVKKQADVVLLIDVSGSMLDEGKLDQAKQAALAFIEQMEGRNRVGLAVFNDQVQNLVAMDTLETNRANIRSRIENLRADGGTALYSGLVEVLNQIARQDDADRIRAVVILSDGADTASEGVTLNDAIQSIAATRDAVNPVIVVPVAYGSNADVNALNGIARASATRVQSGDPQNILRVLQLLSSYF
ncbi:MAG: VWA domain-containing protein [Chloroflexi bacterium]|nr:VWA domain-containing protein [Chloroflexota bacterium]